jgi:hypothetical protein
MSLMGQKQTTNLRPKSTVIRFGPKADKRGRKLIVRFVPKADVGSTAQRAYGFLGIPPFAIVHTISKSIWGMLANER